MITRFDLRAWALVAIVGAICLAWFVFMELRRT